MFLFILAFVYAASFLIITVILFSIPELTKRINLIKLSVLGLFIRLIPTLFFPFGSGHDISSFLWAGQRILDGKDIYYRLGIRFHYAFLPAFGFLTAGCIKLAGFFHIPEIIFMKLIIIFFDVCIGVLLVKITKKWSSGFLYTLCPIPVIVSSYLGQFDAIPLFFLLLGFYYFEHKKTLKSMISIGIGMTFKPWPIIFVPFLLLRLKQVKYVLHYLFYLCIPVSIVLLIYKLLIPQANLIIMSAIVILYESVLGWWGVSIFFQLLADSYKTSLLIIIPALISKISILLFIGYLSLKLKKDSVYCLAKYIILTIYIFSFGFGVHYLLWIFPFALITKDKMTKSYILLTGLYYLFYCVFHLLDYHFQSPELPSFLYHPLTLLLWGFFVFWGGTLIYTNRFGQLIREKIKK